MTRREAREQILALIYEAAFQADRPFSELYETTVRELPMAEDPYVRSVFLGMEEKLPELDADIDSHTVGWKPERLAKMSRAIMRLALYEMRYSDDVPAAVAIDEAVELAKAYDDDKAPAFINGILNAAARERGDLGGGEKPEES
ncbi:MAG: transcription antitermination factor NusB [Clostridia bacterium]|nr:transcription antitermination factor NusB [Clostridia bacterium]